MFFVLKRTYDDLVHDYANLVIEMRGLRETEKALAETTAELDRKQLLLSILEGEMTDYHLLISDVQEFLQAIPDTITSGRGGRKVLSERNALVKRIEGLAPRTTGERQEEEVEAC